MSMVETSNGSREVATKMPSFGAELKSKQSQFVAALPAHIPAERFMRVVMTAIQRNPDLIRADRQSLWNASMQAAQDGLLPDGREGALVIYNTKDGKDERGKDRWIAKVQWMPMIAGIRKKVRNSGEIETWDAQVVHARDQFEFALGDEPFIRHKPFLDGDPGPVIAAYSIATLKSGEKSREVMTKAQIDKVRAASKSRDNGPWVTWYEEMCRKTVARRHSKVLPMSTDLDDLVRRDDALYDMSGARDEAKAAAAGRLSLAAKLDALVAGSQASEADARDDEADAEAQDEEDGAGNAEMGREEREGPEEEEAASPAAAAQDNGSAGRPAASSSQSAAQSEDVREATLAKLRAAAVRGKHRLKLVKGGLTQAERAVITTEDWVALDAAAEKADA